MSTSTEEQAQRVPIDSLKAYKGNARIGDIDAIRRSLRANGQYRPVVVRRKTREVLAGKHTWEAARQEGWTEIDVWFVDCDAAQARRINLADNRIAELGSYDHDLLVKQLAGMPSLEGTGWGSIDVDRLTSALIVGVKGDTDPREVPPAPAARRGDLFLLGAHRLLCGDATNQHDVQRLMNSEQAVCMWTDPPYIGPDDNSSHGDNAAPDLVGHSVDGLGSLLQRSFELADQSLVKGAAIYMLHPGGAHCPIFLNAFVERWHLRQTLVWLKEAMILGYHHYHMKHELIAYGHTRGRPKDRGWYGNQQQCSVLQFDRPKAKLTKLHPAARPVGLVEVCVVNSTPSGGLVYEPFAGAGSTLIACENLRRRCFCMELDPGYCEVVVDRWQRHTGLLATVEHAGA